MPLSVAAESMNSRERMLAAYDYKTPDVVPVEFLYAPVGFYQHGEKLNDLFEQYQGDYEPFVRYPKIILPPESFDSEGRYYEKKTDEWGTTWEFRIYGVWGIECQYPLDDWNKLTNYKFPPLPPYVYDSKAFELEQADISQHQKKYFCRRGGFGFFEKLLTLRPFEDVLCDMYTGEPKLIELIQGLYNYYEKQIDSLIKLGVDAVHFSDDYGTQENLIFSKDIFCEYFKPLYKKLMRPINAAGIKVHFHSCGKIDALFEDFKEMGVDSIWPQLPSYDMKWLADCCRDLQIAIAIHTDRANTMTYGKPDDVKELVKKEFEIFRPDKGGSWFYIEVDNDFPYENIEALVKQVFSYR